VFIIKGQKILESIFLGFNSSRNQNIEGRAEIYAPFSLGFGGNSSQEKLILRFSDL
jgi:hypothetical protein